MSDRTILVIDDSNTIRKQLRLILGGAGFEVAEAADGLAGFRAIRDGSHDAIICDVHMPGMTGLEMVERLAEEGVSFPPLVMLTTEGQPEMVTRAKKAGAAGWMMKPVKPDALVSVIERLLSRAGG